jgi:hypothetical protein
LAIGAESRRERSRLHEFVLDLLAIFFALLAPYLNFVLDKGFVFEVVNLAVIGVFAAVSATLATLLWFTRSDLLRVGILTFLLLLFVDIQLYWDDSWLFKLGIGAVLLGSRCWRGRRQLSLFVSVVLGTVIVGTLVLTLWNGSVVGKSTARPSNTVGDSALPVYVHIILDEFMGPEGFDTNIPSHQAIKKEIQAFFSNHGFRLFGRAYSPYYDTYDSVSAAFNMVETLKTEPLREIIGSHITVTQNRYFEILRARGYDLNVYESDYIDYCATKSVPIGRCITYAYDGASSASLAKLGTLEKARVILTLYANLATLSDVAFETYGVLRSILANVGLALPSWIPLADQLGPISVMPVFDELIRDVAVAQGGSMYFAHLLIPHHPYSMDSNCRIRRPVMTWRVHLPGYTKMYEANTAASRLARYEEYIPQVRCALSKVKELLDALKARGLYDNATIIVHGDHGSRLVNVRPTAKNRRSITPQDYSDAFLALYAVKSPGILPGYDPRPASLPQLMQALVEGGLNTPAGPGGGRQPRVYFRESTTYTDLEQVPVPCAADAGSGKDSALPATGLAAWCVLASD